MQIVSFVVERKIHLGRVKSGLRCKCDLAAIFALKIILYVFLSISFYLLRELLQFQNDR